MPKPKLLGIRYARLADPVRQGWERDAQSDDEQVSKPAKAKMKSLGTLESRIRANVLTAGDTMQHDRWPACLSKDYGKEIPNLFRFELADRWRGYYSLIGESGGVRAVILYLWNHETYSEMSGYAKK